MTDHPIFAYINEIDYLRFYTNEIAARTTTGYPPIKRLVEVELKHTDESIVEQEAHQVAAYLRTTLPSNSSTILGPARPPVHMIQKIHFRKIYIKTDTLEHVLTVCNQLTSAATSPYTSSIFFTPNPTA
jgi:primosomal protein N'